MKGRPAYGSETILPKGVIELIFSFGDRVSLSSDQHKVSAPRCFVTGIRNTPVKLIAPVHQSLFGIELEPAAVKKLLRLPSSELLNEIIDLEIINKDFTTLWHLLAEQDDFNSRVNLVEHWLLQRPSLIQPRELLLSRFLEQDPGAVSVSHLASELCYSPRQLHRKSAELFGMSTEGLISYRRYIHALQFIHRSSESLTRIGYQCNYYDQAHFIREFKDYTGITPGEYRQQKSRLAGHLYQ